MVAAKHKKPVASKPRSKPKAPATPRAKAGASAPIAATAPTKARPDLVPPIRRATGNLAAFITAFNKEKPKGKAKEKESPGASPNKAKLKGESKVHVLRPIALCSERMPSDTAFIPTRSPLFNLFLSERVDGGLPIGRVIEFYGQPDQGKTSLLTECMIAFQEAGGIVLFHDSDYKWNRERALRRGWKEEEAIYVPDAAIEDILDNVEKTVINLHKDKGFEHVPILFAWDSAPSTPLRANLPGTKKGDDKGGMANAARVMWDRLSRRLVGFLAEHHVTLIATSPEIAQIGGGSFFKAGPQRTTALGGSIKTQATIRARIWRAGKVQYSADAGAPVHGVYIGMKATKNHLRLYADQQISVAYLFESGFSPANDVVSYLALTGALAPDGEKYVGFNAGYYYPYGLGRAMRYAEVVEQVKADPELLEKMKQGMAEHYVQAGRVLGARVDDDEDEKDEE